MGISIWTTQDEQKIPITNMDDRHILNTHRMLCGNLSGLLEHKRTMSGYIQLEYEARAFGFLQWIDIFRKEADERDLAVLARKPVDEALEHIEPSWLFDKEGYWAFSGNIIHLTELTDRQLLLFQKKLVDAVEAPMDYMRSTEPQGDAAQDAFDREFREAMELEIEAGNILPIVNGEVDRRGLVKVALSKRESLTESAWKEFDESIPVRH